MTNSHMTPSKEERENMTTRNIIPDILNDPRLNDPNIPDWEKYTKEYYDAMYALAVGLLFSPDGARRGFVEFRYHVPCRECAKQVWIVGLTYRFCYACGAMQEI